MLLFHEYNPSVPCRLRHLTASLYTREPFSLSHPSLPFLLFLFIDVAFSKPRYYRVVFIFQKKMQALACIFSFILFSFCVCQTAFVREGLKTRGRAKQTFSSSSILSLPIWYYNICDDLGKCAPRLQFFILLPDIRQLAALSLQSGTRPYRFRA